MNFKLCTSCLDAIADSRDRSAMEGAVQAALEKIVMKTAQVIESELDAEIDRLDNLDSDELDRLR